MDYMPTQNLKLIEINIKYKHNFLNYGTNKINDLVNMLEVLTKVEQDKIGLRS